MPTGVIIQNTCSAPNKSTTAPPPSMPSSSPKPLTVPNTPNQRARSVMTVTSLKIVV